MFSLPKVLSERSSVALPYLDCRARQVSRCLSQELRSFLALGENGHPLVHASALHRLSAPGTLRSRQLLLSACFASYQLQVFFIANLVAGILDRATHSGNFRTSSIPDTILYSPPSSFNQRRHRYDTHFPFEVQLRHSCISFCR